MKRSHTSSLTLAIDPYSHGLGYAVLQGPHSLIDWGLRRVPDKETRGYLRHVSDLLRWYAPDKLVMEDFAGPRCRKGARMRRILRQAGRLAEHRKVTTKLIRWPLVRVAIGKTPRVNKDDIAAAVAAALPELRPALPVPRKSYVSEHPRINIFDAVALGLTSMAIQERRQRAT